MKSGRRERGEFRFERKREMIRQTKQALQGLIRRVGFDLVRYSPEENGYPPDFTAEQIATIEAVAEYTMTTAERIVALIDAVRYIVSNGIGGDFVECGVWRGGSMMAVARTLLTLDAGDRHLYLYDTFEGMTEPGAVDVNYRGEDAREQFQKLKIDDTSCDWCFASIDDVRRAMASTGYDMAKVSTGSTARDELRSSFEHLHIPNNSPSPL
jgi:O-methyltransferase